MTVRKAIRILDWWIDHKKTPMEKLLVSWNYDPNNPSEVEKLLIETTSAELNNLQIIRAELVPNCKHPKKMIDTLPDGQKYCMSCNFDLD